MLTFLFAVIILATPAVLIMWKRRYYEGLLIAQVLFLFMVAAYLRQALTGPVGWIANFETLPRYAVRWVIPMGVRWWATLLGTTPWMVWLFFSTFFWFCGSIKKYEKRPRFY